MTWVDLCLRRSWNAAGDVVVRLGVPQLDAYLEFLSVRSRPNTVLAVGYDLRVFFAVVGKPPAQVTAADVLEFVTAQHTGASRRRMVGDRPDRVPTGVHPAR
jgi:integrase/recombinase XerD